MEHAQHRDALITRALIVSESSDSFASQELKWRQIMLKVLLIITWKMANTFNKGCNTVDLKYAKKENGMK